MPGKPRWSGVRQVPPPRQTAPDPMFFRGWVNHLGDDQRDLLRILSLNDWYGRGVLFGLGLVGSLEDEGRVAMHYAGRTACENQYLQGIRHGREMKRAGIEPALVSEDPPEEGGDRGPDPTPQ